MSIDEQKLKRKLSSRKILFPVLLGLSVVGFMLYQNYHPDQFYTVLQASPFWICMSLLVLFVRDFGYMYRIRFITDKVLSWKQSFKVIMLWEFASCALPSVVGGSTIASYILFKEKIALGRSIAQVMVTAMLDNFYFILAVPFVLVLMQGQLLPAEESLNSTLFESLKLAFIVSYVMITVYACSMFYALFINPDAVRRLLLSIGKTRLFRRWESSLTCHADELLVASCHMRTKPVKYWLHASISTAFVWTARYLIIGCLIAAFADLSMQEHFTIFARNLMYKIVLFVSVTPGAAGFAEISFPAFFGMFIGSMTTIVVLLYRLLTYHLYLILGAVILPRWTAEVFKEDPKTVSDTELVLPHPNKKHPLTV